MRRVALLVAALVVFAAGYFMGARTIRLKALTVVNQTPAPQIIRTATVPPDAPPDYQSLKNQLAICMAFHPASDETEKQLAMCRSDLAAYRGPRPTIPNCYDFADAAATYDRELGEADASPETLDRATHLTAVDCGAILEWSSRASYKQTSCLSGTMPVGWKERYGRPIGERPFVKACRAMNRVELMNAWFRYQEDRVRETGHDPKQRLHMSPDGGVRVLFPPFPDED